MFCIFLVITECQIVANENIENIKKIMIRFTTPRCHYDRTIEIEIHRETGNEHEKDSSLE